jgi:hypothetical protein
MTDQITIIIKCAQAKGRARRWIRNRAVYVARLKAGQTVADVRDIRQTAAWERVGIADSRYTGPRSGYSALLAQAEAVAAEWRAAAAASN